MKGESFTFITRSGEDIWKTMGIVEVMQKTGIVSSKMIVYPIISNSEQHISTKDPEDLEICTI